MKLPKHAPESTLIATIKPRQEYKQTQKEINKTHQYQRVTNAHSIQNNHKRHLIPELSQNYPSAFHHIYPATYQVYITFHPVPKEEVP
ncbi:hypothetical protein [Enterobacter bugandensis]|uniref:hypothetical protein n=1 Tax=Enterobacter bugandensis TaxID=881260 RepID=UPI002005AEB6|nr:hypothetical protein [Enterobacter bugandensis]MCK6852142.1 hypothetical protein [Enterobacter bugandensis]HCM9231559.1 hypothetical protein [Enterobacter bugandensis]